jgi:hypothetical protein
MTKRNTAKSKLFGNTDDTNPLLLKDDSETNELFLKENNEKIDKLEKNVSTIKEVKKT